MPLRFSRLTSTCILIILRASLRHRIVTPLHRRSFNLKRKRRGINMRCKPTKPGSLSHSPSPPPPPHPACPYQPRSLFSSPRRPSFHVLTLSAPSSSSLRFVPLSALPSPPPIVFLCCPLHSFALFCMPLVIITTTHSRVILLPLFASPTVFPCTHCASLALHCVALLACHSSLRFPLSCPSFPFGLSPLSLMVPFDRPHSRLVWGRPPREDSSALNPVLLPCPACPTCLPS